MTHRRVLGVLVGAAAITAIVVPTTADAEDGTAPPAGQPVVATPLDPGALDGVPTSSPSRVGSGAVDPEVVTVPPAPGVPEPQIIIGNDGRVRVEPTIELPASAVAWIHVNPVQPGLDGAMCTGWFYSPDAVATAAHCIEYDDDGAFYTVIPGRDGATAPFPSCSNLEPDGAHPSKRWDDLNDGTQRPPTGPAKHDYAVLELNEALCDYGDTLGQIGFRQVPDSTLRGKQVTINGYPEDKGGGSEQWSSSGKVKGFNKYVVRYKNDTNSGMSGSPVYRSFNNCGTCAIGIHTFGNPSTPINGGTRIRPKVARILNSVDDEN